MARRNWTTTDYERFGLEHPNIIQARLHDAAMTPAIDPRDLRSWFATGRQARAWAELAKLNAAQLSLQAEVHAATYNDDHGLVYGDRGALTGEQILARWNERLSQLEVELLQAA